MKIEIVTKSGIEEVREAERIIAESVDGDIEILEGHAPMLAFIVPGEMRFFKGDTEEIFQVGEGILEVQKGRVKLLLDYLNSFEESDK